MFCAFGLLQPEGDPEAPQSRRSPGAPRTTMSLIPAATASGVLARKIVLLAGQVALIDQRRRRRRPSGSSRIAYPVIEACISNSIASLLGWPRNRQ